MGNGGENGARIIGRRDFPLKGNRAAQGRGNRVSNGAGYGCIGVSGYRGESGETRAPYPPISPDSPIFGDTPSWRRPHTPNRAHYFPSLP